VRINYSGDENSHGKEKKYQREEYNAYGCFDELFRMKKESDDFNWKIDAK
jgi:hypothetical protein